MTALGTEGMECVGPASYVHRGKAQEPQTASREIRVHLWGRQAAVPMRMRPTPKPGPWLPSSQASRKHVPG